MQSLKHCSIYSTNNHQYNIQLGFSVLLFLISVRGTPKFQYSDSATLVTLAIPVTLCNCPPKKLHQVTTPIDHPVHVTYCLPLPHCSPFYFYALLLPSYSISISFYILFPILSIFHILPLSLFCDLLLVAVHSVPYVVPLHLGSP